jgi:hypothetical protein
MNFDKHQNTKQAWQLGCGISNQHQVHPLGGVTSTRNSSNTDMPAAQGQTHFSRVQITKAVSGQVTNGRLARRQTSLLYVSALSAALR